jgi:branched-chain amino acid transport system permease protein
MKAMRGHENAAQASGIYLLHYKVLSFVVAAFFAGIAGSLYAHFISFVSPDAFTLGSMIDMLFMIVLGGLGSVPGAVLGAIVVTALPEVLRILYEVREFVYSILIILILIYAPTGVWGLVEQMIEWVRFQLTVKRKQSSL